MLVDASVGLTMTESECRAIVWVGSQFDYAEGASPSSCCRRTCIGIHGDRQKIAVGFGSREIGGVGFRSHGRFIRWECLRADAERLETENSRVPGIDFWRRSSSRRRSTQKSREISEILPDSLFFGRPSFIQWTVPRCQNCSPFCLVLGDSVALCLKLCPLLD